MRENLKLKLMLQTHLGPLSYQSKGFFMYLKLEYSLII